MTSYETARSVGTTSFLLLQNTTTLPLAVTVEFSPNFRVPQLDGVRVRGETSALVDFSDAKAARVVVVMVSPAGDEHDGLWLDVPPGYPMFDVMVLSVIPLPSS